ncbi:MULTISPECIES: 16S rRNA (cytosine(1402)-N(4))-methyltransferase RsmH [Paraclostridium]|uniref:Ribosomal RNA small subunit methyltransferase H n=1 Tax=Paraclostridium bifermentans TaxID=1490 RepID=A0AA44DI10_PARBF|nr:MULTISPECIES: 16S rRNA (cytosine(1402)-N(4))-methyltransferase RsmH [Paraclostridium]MBN8048473.1 16S rRNA (cytosine(1402)-N(4))-methyltransferase RsmH [Paraclostridium bifermentans]MBZ6006543.1 16S rRNA (cytosine(1402)-N(4))-methyltransferase RsmH [Paraclostridium bifermentans]MDU0297577.1 16S rRNA (cytosine(1402)-N(4))-methyltransferase RsmH [Paraclostridium sp. MRS3W1]NME07933.1 16S rRNA (cytosine(1402)-N(4))-methyltransferase RsmH [Paraclostridium bifermentans]
MEFHHVSVLLDECIDNLNIKPDGVYVDCTMGGAGHSKEIVKRLSKDGLFIGFDQDINAINTAKERLSEYSDRVKFVHSNFQNLKNELEKIGVYKVDGVLADLGVSSHQLDEADRGFSYMQDAPLDMRMDIRCSFSAYDVVNTYSEAELSKIIKDYGEDNWAKRIAKFIVEGRKEKNIETTGELVEIIKKAIPKKARIDGPHPAKRTFQAIRIEVNDELGVITEMIDDAASIMNEGGRICIITFHSLEDRIVKNAFRDLATDCICPPHIPICQCDKEALVKVITRKPILPTDKEIEENPRSRSAKLRVAERI